MVVNIWIKSRFVLKFRVVVVFSLRNSCINVLCIDKWMFRIIL